MGLFDKIIKDAINGKIEDVIQKHTGIGMNNTDRKEEKNDYSVQKTLQNNHGKEYFAEILASEFSQYEVKENVPVSDIGGIGKAYDFGLYSNGKLVAVIPLVEHNRDHNRAYLGGREAAKKENIPFINFYLHMTNERNYVINRIKRLIAK